MKGIKDRSRITQELKWVAGILRVGFINTEGLKSKSQNRNCSGLLEQNKMLGTAESWIVLEKCEIRGYKTFNKSRFKLTRHRRNPGGLVLFIHLVLCLTTGPKPLPNQALHIVRSRASSFKCEYPLLSLRSSCSFLHFLPWLPVTFIPPFIFPSITRTIC